MRAIQILVNEHEHILTMIKAARVLFKEDNGERLDVEDVKKLIDFIQNFADKYHHLKEEDVLFIEMELHGMSAENGPIAVMLHEHNQGRAYIRQTLEGLDRFSSGDSSAYSQIKENILNYCDLLTNHIQKENNILYPMAERLVPQDVLNEMSDTFEKTNASTLNDEYAEVYLKMVEEFSAKYLNK